MTIDMNRLRSNGSRTCGAVVVVCAASGVEVGTELMWKQLEDRAVVTCEKDISAAKEGTVDKVVAWTLTLNRPRRR